MTNGIEYASVLVKGLTMGLTATLAVTMFLAIKDLAKSKWQAQLFLLTGIAMTTLALQLIYRAIIEALILEPNLTLTSAPAVLDTLAIPPFALMEIMLTRHKILKGKTIWGVYAPFILFVFLHFLTGWEMVATIALAFSLTAGIIWATMTYRDMKRFHSELMQIYANVDDKDLAWLPKILIMLISALMVWCLSTFIGTEVAKITYRLAIVSVWFAYCYKILKQKEAVEMNGELISKQQDATIKNLSNDELPAEIQMFGAKLKTVIQEKELFKQYDLTSTIVAQEMGCERAKLANYFAMTRTTFFAYINDMRLEYAVEELLTTRNTINDIAMKAGYQFENSFRREFVLKFDCMPNEYREKYKKQQ